MNFANDQQSTAQTDTELVAARTSDQRVRVLVAYISSDVEQTVTLKDGAGGSTLFSQYVPANGGVVVSGGGMPLFWTSKGTALVYDSTVAGGIYVHVVYDVGGFQ